MTDTVDITTVADAIRWADRHHFYLVPMVSAFNGVCAIHGEGCKGKHPKYKKDTLWSLNRERLFLLECGLSHILVLDVDPRNGGMESLVNLMGMCGDLNPQVIVRTGSGGYHYYYADWIRPSRFKPGTILPGIDIKAGQNAYVVCPGMPHHSGNYYKLVKDGIPTDVPERLEEFILKTLAIPQREKPAGGMQLHSPQPTLFDLLDMTTFKDTGQGWRGAHPVHGSTSGQNFIITPDGCFWHCFRHGTSGGRKKLQQMLNGTAHCEDFA